MIVRIFRNHVIVTFQGSERVIDLYNDPRLDKVRNKIGHDWQIQITGQSVIFRAPNTFPDQVT